jgi:hypothetical protein
LIVGALLVTAGTASAGFKKFTHVDDVCPTCTTGPVFDHIQLRGGDEIRGRIVAENEAFYVVERFGEWRAVDKGQIANLVRTPGSTLAAGLTDQILLKDDTVIAGTIDGDVSNAVESFTINVPGTPIHHEARATVAAVYRNGKKVYTGDATPAPAAATPAAATPAAAPAAAPAPAAVPAKPAPAPAAKSAPAK